VHEGPSRIRSDRVAGSFGRRVRSAGPKPRLAGGHRRFDDGAHSGGNLRRLDQVEGDSATVDRAKATYLMAKADMDGVIAGLETVLGEGGKPGNLPTVRPSLEATASSLKAICAAAFATATPNTRGVWDEIARGVAEAAIEPVVNKISDGVAALWAHYVIDPDKLALETRKAKLEAARWPEFADIAPR
jgi:hypothetical protein